MKLISSWSGGKDSCYALMLTLEKGENNLEVLLNMMNENDEISRSHGLTKNLLDQQAEALDVPILKIPSSWSEYETRYISALKELKSEYNIDAVVFGDIDLEPHREWEEKVCSSAELEAFLPLWKQDRKELVYAMIDNGIKAIISSCNTTLGENFLGKEITKELVEEMEILGVDACGENGEYHTIVTDCPLFSKPVELPSFSKTIHNNYCFIEWKH